MTGRYEKPDRILVLCTCGNTFVVTRLRCDRLPGTPIFCEGRYKDEQGEIQRCERSYDPTLLVRRMDAWKTEYDAVREEPVQLKLGEAP